MTTGWQLSNCIEHVATDNHRAQAQAAIHESASICKSVAQTPKASTDTQAWAQYHQTRQVIMLGSGVH